ncbi:mannosyltransferase family protein [Caulobacter sp. 1776]|uniref:mannosyltransferase family protein n=1 Tax=Caulobacter sp. 1776 TaxID=3156420 RepID=UPI0033916840
MSQEQAGRMTGFMRGSAPRPALDALSTYAIVPCAFVASRLALLVVGLLTQVHIRPLTTAGNPMHLSHQQALNIWGAWDTGWYLDLILNGYQRAPTADGQANWAFFPAFPALAKGLALLTGLTPLQAMLTIANVSFFLALVLIHRLARAEFDKKTADLAVVLLCVAPGSYIFSSAYTEALFLAAVTGSLLLMRRQRWMAAGTVAALAVLTRNLGVGLLLPYAWMVLERLRAAVRPAPGEPATPLRASEILRIGFGGLIPVAALLAFMLYLRERTGDALAFLHIQKGWRRSLDAPFSALFDGLLHPSRTPDADLLSLAAAWLAIGLLVALALTRKWPLFLLALFLALVPLATGVASFSRYALVIAPLWLVLARTLADRPRAAMTCASVLAVLNGFMMVAWTLALPVAA